MKNSRKLLALVMAAVMVLALLAGCGDSSSPAPADNSSTAPADSSSTAPADNSSAAAPADNSGSGETGRVYWLNFKPELDETAQALAASYTEQTGVPVQVVTAASGTYNQTLIAEMDKSAAPTLFVIGNSA
ncbi:MAG: ABC transporter substrate-binding protein, partial [Butyricicoccus sp.]|nr:ABC transporter substrate-binding protein [Butyricicoccus sp.]